MLDLVDVWRVKTSQSRSYTWSQKSQLICCRLDYWLISNNLQDFVNTTDIIPAIKTDHAAIELNLTESNQHSKRPGFWKMNVSLLEDPNILKELRQNIPVSKTTGSDILSYKRYIWDWLYNNIRNHANFVLENMLWKKTYNTYTRRPKKTKNKKTKLNKTKNRWTLPTLIIRARARWHEHGERIKVYTNYFLTLQKLTQKTYKKTANKRFHYILPFLLLRHWLEILRYWFV